MDFTIDVIMSKKDIKSLGKEIRELKDGKTNTLQLYYL